MQTVSYGIRNEEYMDARYSQMPAFGRDELLSEEEVQQATHFVLSLSGSDHDAQLASAGAEVQLFVLTVLTTTVRPVTGHAPTGLREAESARSLICPPVGFLGLRPR